MTVENAKARKCYNSGQTKKLYKRKKLLLNSRFNRKTFNLAFNAKKEGRKDRDKRKKQYKRRLKTAP